jgi:lipid A 4'-phosphatase
MSQRSVLVLMLTLALAALVLALWPGLDLAFAGLFAAPSGGFVGMTPLGRDLRNVFYVLPSVILALCALLWLARRAGAQLRFAPGGREMLFLALSFLLGPGLLINGVLKEHSHRPRPNEITAFGGTQAFRPWYRFDGECLRNCSFVSGEAASATWTFAPASLLPPPIRVPAEIAALVFAAAAGLLRAAFGGHFPSDVVIAALLTLAVVEALRRVLLGPLRDRGGSRVQPERILTPGGAGGITDPSREPQP